MATGSPIRVQHSDQIASGHLYDGFAVYSYLTASDIPFEVDESLASEVMVGSEPMSFVEYLVGELESDKENEMEPFRTDTAKVIQIVNETCSLIVQSAGGVDVTENVKLVHKNLKFLEKRIEKGVYLFKDDSYILDAMCYAGILAMKRTGDATILGFLSSHKRLLKFMDSFEELIYA